MLLNGAPQTEENGNEKASSQNNQLMLSQILANSSTPSFHELYALGPNGSTPVRRTHKCCVYIAGKSKYCVRLNSIQAFSDINRDVSLRALSWAFPMIIICSTFSFCATFWHVHMLNSEFLPGHRRR